MPNMRCLRSEEGLTRISEDPTILSGTLRSTLDVFDEYQDAEIVSIIDAAYLATLTCRF